MTSPGWSQADLSSRTSAGAGLPVPSLQTLSEAVEQGEQVDRGVHSVAFSPLCAAFQHLPTIEGILRTWFPQSSVRRYQHLPEEVFGQT